jgi:hypothetical protein
VLVGFRNPEIRKDFFEKYELDNKFDPLIPANWYNLAQQKIISIKVKPFFVFFICFVYLFLKYLQGANTMDHSDNSTPKALDLLPDIGLEMQRFWKCNKSFSPLSSASPSVIPSLSLSHFLPPINICYSTLTRRGKKKRVFRKLRKRKTL